MQSELRGLFLRDDMLISRITSRIVYDLTAAQSKDL